MKNNSFIYIIAVIFFLVPILTIHATVTYHTYTETFSTLPEEGKDPIYVFEDLINEHRLVSVIYKEGFNIKQFYYNNACWVNGIGKI
ncbi:MAG: hypothetical protein J7M10_01275, partial [Candidatus Cloacimonetes bacterium]|nr:hypothetical protein [Candidatus Cloacimonadota bacterium]